MCRVFTAGLWGRLLKSRAFFCGLSSSLGALSLDHGPVSHAEGPEPFFWPARPSACGRSRRVKSYLCLSHPGIDFGSESPEYAWHLPPPPEAWLQREELRLASICPVHARVFGEALGGAARSEVEVGRGESQAPRFGGALSLHHHLPHRHPAAFGIEAWPGGPEGMTSPS